MINLVSIKEQKNLTASQEYLCRNAGIAGIDSETGAYMKQTRTRGKRGGIKFEITVPARQISISEILDWGATWRNEGWDSFSVFAKSIDDAINKANRKANRKGA